MNIKQEQGEPTTMEGSPHDGWIDSTTTCRPTPPLPFPPQTDIYLHNVQNGETERLTYFVNKSGGEQSSDNISTLLTS